MCVFFKTVLFISGMFPGVICSNKKGPEVVEFYV